MFVEYYPFYQCCTEAVQKLKQAEGELYDLMDKSKSREMTEAEENQSFLLQHQIDMYEVSAPIFAITTAESFINWYSSTYLQPNSYLF